MTTPQRMCVVCRNMLPKDSLVRVIKTKEGNVSVDNTKKASGRGAYVCKDPRCREKLIKSRALERALDAQISEDVINNIMKELI